MADDRHKYPPRTVRLWEPVERAWVRREKTSNLSYAVNVALASMLGVAHEVSEQIAKGPYGNSGNTKEDKP